MHDYPLHLVETDLLLHESDLIVELARRPGTEILLLFKLRLGGLLNPGITSISIADDGLVRVLSNNPDLSEYGEALPYGSMAPMLRVAFNLFEAVVIPRRVRTRVDPAFGFSPDMLDWAVRACLEPSIALSLKLVDESALPLIEVFSDAERLQGELEEHQTAVNLLLRMCNDFADLLQPFFERKVIKATVEKLGRRSAFGLIDGCESYWSELCDIDAEMVGEQITADVRETVLEVMSELDTRERLALLLAQYGSQDWLKDGIENQDTPEGIEEVDLDSDSLVDGLVEAVLYEAAGQRLQTNPEQSELFS